MKTLILNIIPLMFFSCTTYKKDDHSYTYFYQHNVYQKSQEEEKPPIQTYNKNNSDRIFYRTQERNMLDTSVDLSKYDPDFYYQNDSDDLYNSRQQPYYKGNGVTHSPQVRKYLRYGETRR